MLRWFLGWRSDRCAVFMTDRIIKLHFCFILQRGKNSIDRVGKSKLKKIGFQLSEVFSLHRRIRHAQNQLSVALSWLCIIKWRTDFCRTLVQTIPKWCPWAEGYDQGWHIGGISSIPISPIWFSNNRYIGRYLTLYRPIYRWQCYNWYRYICFVNIGFIGRYSISADTDVPTLDTTQGLLHRA